MEYVESGVQTRPWGERLNGRLILTPAARWMVIQTAEGRQRAQDDVERAAAFRSLLAYSGTYCMDADKIILTIDISWDEAWVGTDQIRLIKLEGDRPPIEALPQPYANFGGKVMRGLLTWERDS